jgi:hypothetical protein
VGRDLLNVNFTGLRPLGTLAEMIDVRSDYDGSATDAAPMPGGQGGPFLSTAGQTSDTRLQGRAIRERWPIPPEFRARIIVRLWGIVISPNASRREVMSAIRALIAAERQNQADDHLQWKLERKAPAVSVNVGSQAPAPPGPLSDKPTLVEAMAELAQMGYIDLSEQGREMVRQSQEQQELMRATRNGHAALPLGGQ